MARHYRGKGAQGDTLKLAVMFIIAVSLLFVLCRLYPQSMPRAMVKAADRIAAAFSSAAAQLQSASRPQDQRPSASQQPSSDDKQTAAKTKTEQPDAQKKSGAEEAPDQPGEEEQEPSDNGKPPLAIVIDDGGEQLKLTRRVAALDLPVTWAIMPNCRYTGKCAGIADVKGTPYILHLPMQALSDKGRRGDVIGAGMASADIAKITADCLDQLPNAVGLSNHRGSLATSSKDVIEPVLEVVRQRKLLFFDSRTTNETVVRETASKLGVPMAENSLFLDNQADVAQISARFDEAARIAVQNGGAAVICHFRPASVEFLEKLDKRYKKLPVRLVTLPELIKSENSDGSFSKKSP